LATGGKAPSTIFEEVSSAVGLVFQHVNGATGEYYFPENMGPGVALFDYDNDGDLDVFFTQGNRLDRQKDPRHELTQVAQDVNPHDQLFRNKLIETGKLTFADVTRQSGLGSARFGMGVAVGDYDSDGFLDLYVTGFDSNALFHNNRDGTFSDVTERAGVDDPRWSASAAFVDYDRDGDLDLFVTNYVDFTIKGNRVCHNGLGMRDYCNPSIYRPVPDRLFRNDGRGRFTDVTESAGIGSAFGAGLGVA
jgi:hypothetical protein